MWKSAFLKRVFCFFLKNSFTEKSFRERDFAQFPHCGVEIAEILSHSFFAKISWNRRFITKLQWWKPKQRRNWFCLFLKNPCYDSKIMHVEFWLEVSKVLHLSINPVSWLFTMPELFLPEKAEKSLNVKDYFFAKNDCRNIWKYSFASDMIELWLVIE